MSLAVAFWLFHAEAGLAQTATEQRETAVLDARGGHMARAQATLRAMLAAGADDGLVAMDLATLLQQDHKPREAVRVYEKAAPAAAPDYALLAAARAYRDLRRYDNAARLARQGLDRFQDQTVWPLLLSLVLSDAGRSNEALAILRQPVAQRAPPVERLLAEGYAWRRAGDRRKAKETFSEVLKLAGDNRAEAAKALTELDAGQAVAARNGSPGDAEKALAGIERQLATSPPASAETRRLRREAAVLKARAGHMVEAQAELRALIAAGDDGSAAVDLTALLQQDGKPAEAVAVYEAAAPASPPSYALLAAARAYRDLHRYDDAARLARQGGERFPSETAWPLLLALVLADAGRSDEALAILHRPVAARMPPVDRLLAEAYVWRRKTQPFKALKLYAEAAMHAPENREVRSETAAVLRELGAPFAAAEIAGTTPPIAADEAAAMVRWGTDLRLSDPVRRFEGTDAALARLDAQLVGPSATEDGRLRRQLRLDRMVALRDRVRMPEVVTEGDALRAEEPLPPYAEEAYADALLYLRRPEDARDAYNRVLVSSPKDVMARYGVFYASIEIEDFTTAYATIDSLVADEPIWRGYQDDASRYGNSERAYAEVTAAQGRFYGNQLADAWARLAPIADAAPAWGNARLALYQIANARGWPRRATAEAEIAYSLAPLNVDARIALIESAMANYRFTDAARMLADLLALYPENRAVQRLARDLDARLRWVFEVEAKPSDSEGGGANAAGKGLELHAKLSTPPIDDNWRFFALTDHANAHPPEGYVQRNRVGAGIEWRSPGFTATLYPTQSTGTLSKAGGGATADWWLNDQVQFAFAAERFSWETPLRALLHGITADSYGTKATYRWDESRSVAASFGYLPFTDGNQRLNGGLSYKERLINLPGFDLTGEAGAYASGNSRLDAPYYNPSRDLSLTGGLLAEHVLWRRYDDSLVQALRVDGGLYAENGFRDNWIATVDYEHRWRFDPLTEFRYGLMLTRRVYDGSPEKTVTLTLALTQRF